jgi:DNA-binding transcriptional LysR family regulator
MFSELFFEGGLSLDRLRALVEVGASGSIAKAAGPDPVRRSQYSRQIKELEDFFHVKLVERQGRGLRLTAHGKELARISRFLLLGLSNFRRGCLREEQTMRIGGFATVVERFLIPALADNREEVRFALEVLAEDEVERRLHDLTLDFGVVTREELSRPLQSKEFAEMKVVLWVPKAICESEHLAHQAFKERTLPMALAGAELPAARYPALAGYVPHLACTSFLEAQAALKRHTWAALLPDFLKPEPDAQLLRVSVPEMKVQFRLAWNPRLMRLNPLAVRRRDLLLESLQAVSRSALQPPETKIKTGVARLRRG